MAKDNSATPASPTHWLARYHASQERLYRWSPDPLMAIRLRDDSMVSGTEKGTDPWYPAGCTIVIDPTVDPQPGHRVVVEMGDGLCEFRELGRHHGKLILKPLNPAYATFDLQEWHKIRGVVVQVNIMTEVGKRHEAEWAARQAEQEVANV